MPLANEHSARQVKPGTFERDSFKRKVITNGVSVISGRVKGSEATSVQSVRFDATKFTLQRARKWLKDHGFKADQLIAASGAPATDETDTALEKTDGELVNRHDTLEIGERKWRVDSQGFMHVGATLTTVGVYKYRDRNGNIRREYRPAAEVQSERFMNSLKRAVVTNEHLPNKAPVTIRNVKQYQVGQVGDTITKNGLKVDGHLTLTEHRTVQDVFSGAKRGVSVGYRCKTRYDPGVWNSPNGPIPYDYIQHGHLANHVCVTSVPRGGLGNDGTALHLDSLVSEQVETERKIKAMDTTTITVDKMGVTLPTEVAPIIQTALNKRDSELEEKQKSLTDMGEKIGTLETELEKLTKERDELKVDSDNAPNVGALVNSRLELLKTAGQLLDEESLNKIDSAADDYESQLIDAVLEKNGIDLKETAELYTDSEVLVVYKKARYDGIVAAAADNAHEEMGVAVVTHIDSKGTRRGKEPEYRKEIRERLKVAQKRRDANGTYKEEKTA